MLKKRGLSTAVGDEGGFAPALDGIEDALESICQAIKDAGYEPGKDVKIAMDCAASEFATQENGQWYYDYRQLKDGKKKDPNGKKLTAEEQINYIQEDKLNIYNNNSNAFGLAGYADITFLKDFKLTLNINVYDTENRMRSGSSPDYGYVGTSDGGGISAYHYRTYSLNYQQLLNWSKNFGKHSLYLLLGHEYTRDDGTTTGAVKSHLFTYGKD